MRTVVFASKKHIEWVSRYHLFLEPFLKPELKLCEWKTDGDTLDQIIPSVYDCIEGEKEWRAVIVFDDKQTRSKLNPFDVAEKGYSSVEEKKKLFDEAIKNPLTKLCTYFCSVPVDADAEHIEVEQNDQEVSNNDKTSVTRKIEQNEAMAFNDYKDVANYKNKLRTELLKNGLLKANLPKEVHCVALRTIIDECANNREKINLAWDTSTEMMYSDFGDRNMYYDRMRYFVCDILPEDHVNYKFNYLEFMYTLLIFAGNHVPNDAVQPNRLYCIESDCSEQKLRSLLEQYDQKLENTVHHILREQEEIEGSIPGPMSDEMAEKTFHSKAIIPVMIDSNFNMEGYYTNSKVFGLAQDCPSDEWTVWGNMYHTSDNVMHRFMKQPRRSLEKATGELRRTNKGDSLRALGLNHFQLDDIEEYSESEEDKMISVQTKDFYDIDRYEEDMEKANAKVRDEIATHMTKKTTVMISVVAIIAFAIGFVPVLFHNENVISIPIPVLITLFSLGMLALSGFIALIVFRGNFRKTVEEYNDVMKGIRNDVDESMNKFSDFLSHACHVMKCNFVLNELRKKDNAFKQRIRVLRGHANQIRDKQTELRGLFGEYVAGHPNVSTGDYYKYDYNKVTEYQYPIPFDEYAEKPIYFLEDGHTAIIPYDFISGIKLRMEELYER